MPWCWKAKGPSLSVTRWLPLSDPQGPGQLESRGLRPAILGPVAFGPDVFLSETMDDFSIVVDIVGGIADRVEEGGIAVVGVFETGIDDNWSGNSAGGGPVLSFSM